MPAPRPLVLLLATVLAAPAAAHLKGPVFVDDLIRDADVVFEGSITDVAFRTSRPRKGQPALAHMFVTWHVSQVFKGHLASQTFTARFLGGKPNDDELFFLPTAPRPDVGDHDVVFVRRNGRSICPLARCRETGRFRLFGGDVYSENGNEVTIDNAGGVILGPRHDFPAIVSWEAAGMERIVGPTGDGGDAAPGTTPSVEMPPGPAMSADALRAVLEARVHALYTPRQLERLPVARSVDVEAPFKFRSPKAKKMTRGAVTDPTAPVVHGAADQAELDAFIANGQNPVLP